MLLCSKTCYRGARSLKWQRAFRFFHKSDFSNRINWDWGKLYSCTPLNFHKGLACQNQTWFREQPWINPTAFLEISSLGSLHPRSHRQLVEHWCFESQGLTESRYLKFKIIVQLVPYCIISAPTFELIGNIFKITSEIHIPNQYSGLNCYIYVNEEIKKLREHRTFSLVLH